MNELEIIQGCKNRDESAYRALVDSYSSFLYAICKRYMANDEVARDCLQESLIQIISKIDQYEERGKFRAWMGTVTVKKCLDQLRKEKRFRSVGIEDVQEPFQNENISFKLQKDDVMAFLKTLPDNYRVAINMFLVEGYSHKEIADALGITESSSRSIVSRARRMIVNAFEESMEEESDIQKEFRLKIIRS